MKRDDLFAVYSFVTPKLELKFIDVLNPMELHLPILDNSIREHPQYLTDLYT